MSDDLGSAFSAAVDSAVAGSSDSSSPSPSTPDSTPAATGETPAPTAPSGKDAAAPVPSSTGTPTKEAIGKAAKPAKPGSKSPVTSAPPAATTAESVFTREKHEQGLQNARAKEREAITTEVRTQYGLDLNDRQMLANVRAFAANPAEYIKQYLRHYQVPSQYLYPDATPAPSPPTNVRPEPDLQAEDGTPAYSARQMEKLLDWRMGQVEQSLAQRLTPIEADRQRAESQRILTQVNEDARKEIADASRDWEAFDELRPRIHALMAEDGRRTMATAYAIALKEHLPKLRQQTRESVLAEIKQTPAAPNDVGATVTTRSAKAKSRGLDFTDAVAQAHAKLTS